MKKFILTVLLGAFIYVGLPANSSAEQQTKTIKLKIVIQNDSPNELRKVSPSIVLHGMANSCNQLGKVAGATDKKEKQKETCNLIASFFQLAADVSKENEEKQKNEVAEANNNAKNDSEEKKSIRYQTVRLALDLVNFINGELESEVMRSEPSVYLSMLKDLPNDEVRAEVVERILNDKNESVGFLEEIMNSIKKIIFVSIPEVTTNMLNYLKKILTKGK